MNRKALEMAISTVIVLVLALSLLGVGLFIIYTKIIQPAETVTSIISCESRGGEPALQKDCSDLNRPCLLCLSLPSAEKTHQYCCINQFTEGS